MHSARALSIAIVLVMVGAVFVGAAINVKAAEGTQDSFGYRYIDSNAPPPSVAFNWVDITGTGTLTGVSGDDTYYGPYPIGFTFDFYGVSYTEFYISTNCLISFGSGYSQLSNTYIPNTNNPNTYVGAYWDDMYVRSYSRVYYETMGTAPTQQVVIEYENVTRYGGTSLLTFEIILNQTGDIWIQYLELSGNTGSSATVGIEGPGGTVGVEYSYNSPSLTNGLAILFSVGPIEIGPTQSSSGVPGGTTTYSLSVRNLQAFNDTFEITNTTINGWLVAVFNETMVPLVDTDNDTVPDTGEVVAGGTFILTVVVTVPLSPSTQSDIATMTATSHFDAGVYDSCSLTTTVPDAYFAPPHSDYVTDLDGDGLDNYLVVDVQVTAWVAGWFTVQGTIYTPLGSAMQTVYNGSTYLAVGTHSLNLYFQGWVIRSYAEDGPYHVDLTLRDDGWNIIDTGDHDTSGYAYAAFTTEPAVFSPPHSDYALNSDADSYYEYLVAVASVDCIIPGEYYITGYLYDHLGNYITAYTNYTDLVIGQQDVEVFFDGQQVELNAESGTFTVYFYMYFYAESTWAYVGSDTHTTASYTYSEFEPYPAHFEPPLSEYTTDADGDSLYDYLVIEVPVNVSVAGTYIVEGELGDWWDPIGTETNSSYLDVGLHVVELWFPGWMIRNSGDNGPYDLELELRDASFNYWDFYDYTTGSYSWSEFEPVPAQFSWPHSDYGLDLDNDTLYDYLVFEALVDVAHAGNYRIYGELQTWWGSYIEEDENLTYLDVGIQTVELRWTGWIIRNSGSNGAYDVWLELYTEDGDLLDTDTDSTMGYSYTSFDAAPGEFTSPHYDLPVDTDSDSYYDWLVVDVNVTGYEAMDCVIKAVLYDDSWTIIDDFTVQFTMGLGIQTVDLMFDGWIIGANNNSGVYYAYFDLYDTDEHYIDGSSHTTDSYVATEFETTVPVIASSWLRTATTVDGVFSVGEWADATAVSLKTADASNDVDAVMYVKNDGSTLYICYDVRGDTTMDGSDTTSVGFDTDGDDLLSHEAEDEFIVGGMAPNYQTHYEYNTTWTDWRQHCTPFDDGLAGHSGLAGAIGFGPSDGLATPHRIFEYSIPLALLGAAAGDTLGFIGAADWTGGVYDWTTGDTSSWPRHRSSSLPVATYGDLVLAVYTILPPPSTTSSLSGTAGTNNWFLSDVTVTLTATGGEGGVSLTQYRLDGGSWVTYAASFSVTGEGTHTLEFRSQDNADQWEAIKTVQVKIDTVAPVTDADVDGNSVTLVGDDASSGIAMTFYRMDNSTDWEVYTGAVEVTDGKHTIEFYSVDLAGNAESIQSVEVGGGILSNPILWVAIIAAAAIIAALALFFLLAKRKKPKPQQYPQTVYQPGNPPPPPTQ